MKKSYKKFPIIWPAGKVIEIIFLTWLTLAFGAVLYRAVSPGLDQSTQLVIWRFAFFPLLFVALTSLFIIRNIIAKYYGHYYMLTATGFHRGGFVDITLYGTKHWPTLWWLSNYKKPRKYLIKSFDPTLKYKFKECKKYYEGKELFITFLIFGLSFITSFSMLGLLSVISLS